MALFTGLISAPCGVATSTLWRIFRWTVLDQFGSRPHMPPQCNDLSKTYRRRGMLSDIKAASSANQCRRRCQTATPVRGPHGHPRLLHQPLSQ
eukprot:9423676-Pyramimonas_sp.AAC.1